MRYMDAATEASDWAIKPRGALHRGVEDREREVRSGERSSAQGEWDTSSSEGS